MASKGRAKRPLSERLRGMRFMQQSAESELRDKLAAEQAEREKAAHWTLEADDAESETWPIVVVEEGLSDNPMMGRAGRQSFGRFNPKLEKRNTNGDAKEEAQPEAMQEEADNTEEGEIIEVEDKPAGGGQGVSASSRRGGQSNPYVRGVRGGIAKKKGRQLHFNQNLKNHQNPSYQGYLKGSRVRR